MAGENYSHNGGGAPYVLLPMPHMRQFAENIYAHLGEQGIQDKFALLGTRTTPFANKEFKVVIEDTVRNTHVFLIDSMQDPNPSEAYIRLLLALDAVSRADAERITLVEPYFAWGRQDRLPKDARESFNAPTLYGLIPQVSPILRRILTFDLHSDQAQGYFGHVPVDNLPASIVFADYLNERFNRDFSNTIWYSPDEGGLVRLKRLRNECDPNAPAHNLPKERPKENESRLGGDFPGNPAGKSAIVYDDQIDTAGSIILTYHELMEHGAEEVLVLGVHAVFSPKPNELDALVTAEEKMRRAGLQVVTTNSIYRTEDYLAKNADFLTVVPLEREISGALEEMIKPGGSIKHRIKRR